MTLNFKYVRNQNEYHLFVKQMKDGFEYRQDWESFFGIHSVMTDKEIVYDFDSLIVVPPEYPCFLYCNFIDKDIHARARVIDFLPVRKIVNSKNWCRSLNIVVNQEILVDGVALEVEE